MFDMFRDFHVLRRYVAYKPVRDFAGDFQIQPLRRALIFHFFPQLFGDALKRFMAQFVAGIIRIIIIKLKLFLRREMFACVCFEKIHRPGDFLCAFAGQTSRIKIVYGLKKLPVLVVNHFVACFETGIKYIFHLFFIPLIKFITFFYYTII